MVASVPDVKKAGVSLGNIQLRTGQKNKRRETLLSLQFASQTSNTAVKTEHAP